MAAKPPAMTPPAAATGGPAPTASALELAGAVRAGRTTSTELLEMYLERIERLDGPVNAVVTLDVDRARAQARAADAAAARGEWWGPLHGLPCTIKDAIATAGIRSTGGAIELADHVPTLDAPAVARLRRAGAIVFGKTNLPRWSLDVQSFNELFGTTANPWDLTRSPGGSSGGAAAAVAAGFSAFELGTDIGGSIRYPSHCCGVFGLKPTYGIVPQRGYLDHLGGGVIDADINAFGPIARSASDLALLIDVLAAPLPADQPAWRLELPAARATRADQLRVVRWFDGAGALDAPYRALLDAAVDSLDDAGAMVLEVAPPVGFDELHDLFVELVSAATSQGREYEAQVPTPDHRRWLDAQERREALRERWARWFAGDGDAERAPDVLLSPVSLAPALPIDEQGTVVTRLVEVAGTTRSMAESVLWLGVYGVIGLPAAVAPIGCTPQGLPCGIQIVGPRFGDHATIAAAGILEELLGGYRPPPGFEVSSPA